MRRIFSSVLAAFLIFSCWQKPVSASQARPTGSPDLMDGYLPGSIVRFEHLSIEDGLSQNAGLAIYQDRRGYLWIGSQDGLNRYDGYGVRIFKNDPEDPASLSYNSVLSITEDAQGALWVGTWGGGLNRYDPLTETFRRYRNDPEDPTSLSNDTVTTLKQDSAGNLWVGTLGGLERFDPVTDSFQHYRSDERNPDRLSSDAISVIFESSQKQLWIGTGSTGIEGAGLNRLDPVSGQVVRYQHDEHNPGSLASNDIAALFEAPDGALWIGSGGFSLNGAGLDRLDPRTGAIQHFAHDGQDPNSLSGDNVMALQGDSKGGLWIGTWASGLNHMDLSQPGHFAHYRNDPYFPDSLSGDEVWSLFQDRAGTLWIGTSHSGINKLRANSSQFGLFRNNPSDPASLGTNAIGAFSEDSRGNLWVATWGAGLDRMDPRNGHFEHFRHNPEDPDSLSDDLFMDVYVDEQDLVWAGTLGKGLNRLDPEAGSVEHFQHDPADPNSLADDNIAQIIPDGKGGLWIGTFGGLSHLDAFTGKFTNYANDPNRPESLSENKVVSLLLDSQNILWVGTWGGGLNRLDLNDRLSGQPSRAAFKVYRYAEGIVSGLSDDSVWAIHETEDGSLWLGTQAGLNRLDLETGTFEHLTERNGLPNNVVLGILEDDEGRLWLTTNNGLARLEPASLTVTRYDTSDGLQSNEFNSNAFYRSRNGRLYIGGINGFNSFSPEAIIPNPVPPAVVLTRFDLFNEPVSVDLTGGQPIKLTYKQDFISFEFAALDFQAPQKNQYAYKLEGFDRDWVQAGNRRYARYTNLPGGEYVFHVIASNSDGAWNESGVSVPVIITPPPWQTWWFQGALLMFLGVLVAGAFRWRINAIREHNVHLETQISERTTELRDTNILLEREMEQRKRAEAALSKQAADRLKQSEARFQAVFENAAVGIALMGLDRRPIAFNPVTQRIIGYGIEELQDVDPRSLAVESDRYLDIGLFKELEEGKRNSYVMERRYTHKDGRVFWARINYSLVRDLEGKPDYLIGIIEDIDDQKRAAERLAEQEAEYRRTLEQRVDERTAELQEQIMQRQKAEQALAEKAAQEAVTTERTRLARDLHDAVTQTLFSASLIAEVLPEIWELNEREGRKRLEELRQLTRGALAEMRTLLVELRPNALTEIPLPDLLRQLCESLIGRARLPIDLHMEGKRKLPADVQISLYRIAQEALNNVVKHSKATQAIVTLSLNGGVHLSVADNGCGFDLLKVPPDHLGVKIMRERADIIGAQLNISSQPGEGTEVRITWQERG